jgi:HEAT repeat protein
MDEQKGTNSSLSIVAEDFGQQCQVIVDAAGARPGLESCTKLTSNLDRLFGLLNSHDELERKYAIDTLTPLGFVLLRRINKEFREGPNTSRFQEGLRCVYQEIRKGLNTTDLIEALSHSDPEIRVDAVWALHTKSLRGAGLTPEIIRAHIQALRDPHPSVREAAARMLGWASLDLEAYSALVLALQDKDAVVLRQVKLSLNSFRPEGLSSPRQSAALDDASSFSLMFSRLIAVLSGRFLR